jgi:hypothetical protein
MNRHTILLVQPTGGKASRTFADFETVPAAMDGVCQMFEKRLKELNPQMRSITYDINDLYHYVDLMPDLSALVYSPGAPTRAAAPQTHGNPSAALVRAPAGAHSRAALARDAGAAGARWRAPDARVRAAPPRRCRLGLTHCGCAAPRVRAAARAASRPAAEVNAYQPHDKEWIKRMCFQHLKRQASG